jgi:hypothetical protein
MLESGNRLKTRVGGYAAQLSMKMTGKPETAVLLLFTLVLGACGGSQAPVTPVVKPPVSWNFVQLVDSDANGIWYAYAPSIVFKDGVYYVFFCSVGALGSWDYVRYVSSADGKNWSSPTVVLRATAANGFDMAACDPSVVYYQGLYYMYYSSAYTTSPTLYQTVIQVARSANLDGPYLTYTQRGTWEDTPTDPKMIIQPLMPRSQDPIGYGAGQQTVLVRHCELMMWYTDDSLDPNAGLRTYMLQSTDPVSWTPSPQAQISVPDAHSIDIKYDAAKNQYVMTRIINPHTANAYLTRSFSSDGKFWEPFETLIDVSAFPDYANNVGAAGDETGLTVSGPTLVGFGAPWDLRKNDIWGQWDLYGVLIAGQ